MADLPITFSGPMVRALIREIEVPGTGKTQTRRVIKGTKDNSIFNGQWADSYVLDPGNASWREQDIRYRAGDRLYVREHWRVEAQLDPIAPRDMQPQRVAYIADETPGYILRTGRFRQAMHMPKWASRITLLVTDVRVERLQDCSEADAIAEGAWSWAQEWDEAQVIDHARDAFCHLWDAINGEGAWAANPWVVAYSFKPILGHIDQIAEAA